MSKLLYTTDNLVEEIKSLLDEENTDAIDTDADILPAINRAKDYAFDILARKYPEPILEPRTLTLSSSSDEYDIPEDVFEDRILKIEIAVPSSGTRNTYLPVERVSYRDLATYQSGATSAVPWAYAIYGRTIKFTDFPTGSYNARMWVLKDPEELTLPQGRITIVNGASNYVIVDDVGESLTTESDQLGSYVNFIDGQSGEIKGSAQIQTITDNKLTFRSTPLRSTVLNRDIEGDLSELSVSVDDYISPIQGICVPYYGRPTCNFIIRHAVAELSIIKLGGQGDLQALVADFEKQVERTWAGREQTLRVNRKAGIWGNRAARRFIPTTGNN